MQCGATRGGLTRRQVMAAASASALTLTTGPAHAAPEEVASGSVFEDPEGRGTRGRASRGIAGVMVSNGPRRREDRFRGTLAADGDRR